jgi:Protein of Unknown function (DUF2784)
MSCTYLTLLKIILYSVVGTHYILFLGLLLAMPFLIVHEPWYVSLPIVSWLINIGSLRGLKCPLTTLENYLRRQLGMVEIRGFVSAHILFKENGVWTQSSRN